VFGADRHSTTGHLLSVRRNGILASSDTLNTVMFRPFPSIPAGLSRVVILESEET